MPSNPNARITASHAGNGVWEFTCYLHPEIPGNDMYLPGVLGIRQISSPKVAVQVMKDHCDHDHPGVRMKLSRTSDHSPYWSRTYTGHRQVELRRTGAR
jgi:hypothetical protein